MGVAGQSYGMISVQRRRITNAMRRSLQEAHLRPQSNSTGRAKT